MEDSIGLGDIVNYYCYGIVEQCNCRSRFVP